MSTNNRVELTASEMLSGALAGVLRQVENLCVARKPAHGDADQIPWQLHIEGALAELAVAKFLDSYWAGKGKLRDPDLGEVDVRSTPREGGCLILHPDDPDDRYFWLVVGRNGRYRVVGMIMAADGKLPEFWRTEGVRSPAYFVPQEVVAAGGFRRMSA